MPSPILVPIDGSSFSGQALPFAAALAIRTGAPLHIALVLDPSAFIPFIPGEVAIPVYDADLIRERREADQALLDAAVARADALGARTTGALIEGTVVEALLEYRERIGAGLTVMTTHGRGGFARLRLGSVTTAYLTRATGPVLLLHGGEGEAPARLPAGPLLVALDGSPFSETVLPHAVAFAAACDLPLTLVSVVTPQAVPMAPFGADTLLADPSFQEQEERHRADHLAQVAARCPLGTTTHVVSDMMASRAILGEAQRLGAGVIAVSTHGRGGIARAVLGSVADELIRHTHVPVLAYRPLPGDIAK